MITYSLYRPFADLLLLGLVLEMGFGICFDFSPFALLCIIVCSFFIALCLAFVLLLLLKKKKPFEADESKVPFLVQDEAVEVEKELVVEAVEVGGKSSDATDGLSVGGVDGEGKGKGGDSSVDLALPLVGNSVISNQELTGKEKSTFHSGAPSFAASQGNFREYWKKLGLIDVDENTAPATFEIRSRQAVAPVIVAGAKSYTYRHTFQSHHRAPKPQRYYSAFDSAFDGLGSAAIAWTASHPKLPAGWRTPSPDLVDPNFQQFKNEFISPVGGERKYNQ